MRLFGCTTIKSPDCSGLSYKNHTIAIYRDNKLTVGNIDGFSKYEFDCLREFLIEECRWLFGKLGYPNSINELKNAIKEGIEDKWILNNIYM